MTFLKHRSAIPATSVVVLVVVIGGCGGNDNSPSTAVAAWSLSATAPSVGATTLRDVRKQQELGQRATLYSMAVGQASVDD